MDRKRCFMIVALAILFSFPRHPAVAQNLKLPENPRAWLNSPPFTVEMLRGKGVVLYFFEEG